MPNNRNRKIRKRKRERERKRKREEWVITIYVEAVGHPSIFYP